MENKVVNTWWWPEPGNFGDVLTPILFKELFGYDSNYVNRGFLLPQNYDENRPQTMLEREHVLAVGSIIAMALDYTVIWGSGLLAANEKPNTNARYLSVRGPHTHKVLTEQHGISCPPIFGDPALLMPRVFNATKRNKYAYGFFAHYVDTEQVTEWYGDNPDIKIINACNPDPIDSIVELLQCERIISSSLHGIIIAHAYGIPAVWVKHTGRLFGDDIKFRDHFASVGLEEQKAVIFNESKPVSEFSSFPYQNDIQIDLDKIQNAMQEYLDEKDAQ